MSGCSYESSRFHVLLLTEVYPILSLIPLRSFVASDSIIDGKRSGTDSPFCAGGEAKALLLVNVGPGAADVQETTNSLSFAARARNVELTLGNKENTKKWRDMVGLHRLLAEFPKINLPL